MRWCGLVAQTINDLYFVVAVQAVTVPWSTLLLAGGVGLGTALAAALLPALEVARSAPQLGLKRAVLERRAQHVAGRLVLLGVLLAARRRRDHSSPRSAACWPGSRRSSCCCWASRR